MAESPMFVGLVATTCVKTPPYRGFSDAPGAGADGVGVGGVAAGFVGVAGAGAHPMTVIAHSNSMDTKMNNPFTSLLLPKVFYMKGGSNFLYTILSSF